MMRLFGTKKHPKGPDFRQARLLEFDLSGTKFRVKAPPHSEPSHSPTIAPEKFNIYDVTRYSAKSSEEGSAAFENGAHNEFWPFFGLPIIDGCLGQISFFFNTLKTTTKLNLFKADQFEKFIHLLIDSRYKPPEGGWAESNKKFRDYHVPIDWKPVEISGTVWINYQAYARYLFNRISYWLTPITEQHAIFVSFNGQYYTPDFCCEDAFKTLMNQITSTFEVELSEQSRKEKAEAEQRWPDARYSEEVSEREWSKAS